MVFMSLVLIGCATSVVVPQAAESGSAMVLAAPESVATTFSWPLTVDQRDRSQQLAWSTWLAAQSGAMLNVCLCIQPTADATAQSLMAFQLFRQFEQDARRQGVTLNASFMPSADPSVVIIGQIQDQER